LLKSELKNVVKNVKIKNNWKILDIKFISKRLVNSAKPALNRFVNASPPFGRLGLRKTPVGLAPFVGFYYATFGAGVVATQRPITCPKRRLQPNVRRHYFNVIR